MHLTDMPLKRLIHIAPWPSHLMPSAYSLDVSGGLRPWEEPGARWLQGRPSQVSPLNGAVHHGGATDWDPSGTGNNQQALPVSAAVIQPEWDNDTGQS
jgi:hypothetical protein